MRMQINFTAFMLCFRQILEFIRAAAPIVKGDVTHIAMADL